MIVGGLREVGALGFNPVIDFSEQLRQGLAAMVAGDGFMQVPPDAFDRIGFRRVLWQIMQHESTVVPVEASADSAAVVEAGVVADDVNDPITAEALTQIIEVGDEERSVAVSTGGRHQQSAGPPMQRPGDMNLLVVARRDDFGLLATRHPARADFGIEMDIDLILK